MRKITPFLWFDTQAEEAMNFYVSIFRNSKILSVQRMVEGGPVMTAMLQMGKIDVARLKEAAERG